MAIYSDNQSMFNAALGDFARLGFSLVQLGTNDVALLYKGDRVRRFGKGDFTIPNIHDACRQHLSNILVSSRDNNGD